MHNESLTSFKWWLKGFSQPKSYASLLKRLKLTDSSPPPSCWTEAKQTLSERHNWPNHSKTTDFLLIFTSIFFKCLISLNGTLLLAKRKFPENPEQVVYIHRKGQIRWHLAWSFPTMWKETISRTTDSYRPKGFQTGEEALPVFIRSTTANNLNPPNCLEYAYMFSS